MSFATRYLKFCQLENNFIQVYTTFLMPVSLTAPTCKSSQQFLDVNLELFFCFKTRKVRVVSESQLLLIGGSVKLACFNSQTCQ